MRRGHLGILFLILGCNFVSGGKILGIQKFGAGYPTFHSIILNDDGSLSCGNYVCKYPPYYCKVESKSDDSLQNLVSTIECKDPGMKQTDRWVLNQKSPKPGIKINILTEADILQNVNNKKSIEGDGGGGNENLPPMDVFGMMGMGNPFMNMNNNGMFNG